LASYPAFKTFDDPVLQQMRDAAEQFVLEMLGHLPPRWISFLGSSGAGKTMLAKWIKSVFKQQLDWKINWPATESQPYGRIIRHRGGYRTWAGIARSMREGDYRILDDLCDLSFLVIDDIGAEYGTEFINAKLYELLSRREHKWTVITANLSLSDIEKRIDARIASRMIRHGSVVVDVDVQDYNLRET
jgi:DNA replication protein DnaC